MRRPGGRAERSCQHLRFFSTDTCSGTSGPWRAFWRGGDKTDGQRAVSGERRRIRTIGELECGASTPTAAAAASRASERGSRARREEAEVGGGLSMQRSGRLAEEDD